MWVEFVLGSLMLREVFLRVIRFSPLRKKKKITIYKFLMLVLMKMVTLIIIIMIMKVIMTVVITVNNNNNNNNNNNSNLGTAHILRKVLLAKCILYYEGLWFCSRCLRKMEDLR